MDISDNIIPIFIKEEEKKNQLFSIFKADVYA